MPDRPHTAALAQKKGKVESAVKYVKRNFLATWDSVDINEDRRQLHRWVQEIAGQRCHSTTKHRPLELFEEEEREALLPLPKTAWEPVEWKKATLHRDSHVQIDGSYYSAPWWFLHQELLARCTRHRITIYDRNDALLWTHARVAKGKRSTVDSHLPDHRRDLRHRSREHWIGRARVIGAEVEHLAEEIFGSDDVLLKLRQVQAVVSHLETFPRARACAAATRALHFGCLELRAIKKILREGLDLHPLPQKTTRAWSQGSRFARPPNGSLFSNQELTHAHQ